MSAINKIQHKLALSALFAQTKHDKPVANAHKELRKYDEVLELGEWFKQSGFVSGITYTAIPKASPKIILKFRLHESHQQYFALVRGFISLGNRLEIKSDSQHKIFTLEFQEQQAASVKEYFSKVFRLLQNEINYKAALRDLRHLQANYEKAQAEILNKGRVLPTEFNTR